MDVVNLNSRGCNCSSCLSPVGDKCKRRGQKLCAWATFGESIYLHVTFIARILIRGLTSSDGWIAEMDLSEERVHVFRYNQSTELHRFGLYIADLEFLVLARGRATEREHVASRLLTALRPNFLLERIIVLSLCLVFNLPGQGWERGSGLAIVRVAKDLLEVRWPCPSIGLNQSLSNLPLQ